MKGLSSLDQTFVTFVKHIAYNLYGFLCLSLAPLICVHSWLLPQAPAVPPPKIEATQAPPTTPAPQSEQSTLTTDSTEQSTGQK